MLKYLNSYLNFNHSSHDVCTSKELLWLTLLCLSISISNHFFMYPHTFAFPFIDTLNRREVLSSYTALRVT